MLLSVVVVVHDMPFAAARTLHSLSTAYQRGLAADDYEVIVVDNGSARPLDRTRVLSLPGTFRHLAMAEPSPSPARAVNAGLAAASGELVGLIMDGARIATPRLLGFARRAAATHPRPVVTTVGWVLGRGGSRPTAAADTPKSSAAVERVLRTVGWPDDPYRVLDVCRLDGSAHWFGEGSESPALFLPRGLWSELGGMDERFDEPGGGFVALDLYERALHLPDVAPILLLGEGTIHQPHGGISSDAEPGALRERVARWHARCREIKGRDLQLTDREFTYYGTLPEPWRVQLLAAILRWSMDGVPGLADAADLLEPGANAAGIGGGSAWRELGIVRDRLLAARDDAAAAADDARAARAELARVQATRSWRLTAPLRRLAALVARARR